ncbi:hypothetical protein Y1Q_0015823 [Alligator mississippiensis]|uniref:Uncharacterized protein n=1 Tax=Alligator mississippiensis TaxID=8496 RepID=A0A151MH42_ALLMI|nr:hypothetical protein Y1Q_0015823 [Alligator mississippiensis]
MFAHVEHLQMQKTRSQKFPIAYWRHRFGIKLWECCNLEPSVIPKCSTATSFSEIKFHTLVLYASTRETGNKPAANSPEHKGGKQ